MEQFTRKTVLAGAVILLGVLLLTAAAVAPVGTHEPAPASQAPAAIATHAAQAQAVAAAERPSQPLETDNEMLYEASLGLSDAPFAGPANNATIGVGGGRGGSFPQREILRHLTEAERAPAGDFGAIQ